MRAVVEALQRQEELRGEPMRAPDEVAAMLRLQALGWGDAADRGRARLQPETVRRYLDAGGWAPYRAASAADERWPGSRRGWPSASAGIAATPTWCGRSWRAEQGITVSLRTVERAVAQLRRELAAEAQATVRFETPPGRQMQIDFGSTTVVHRRRARAGLPVRRDARLLAARSTSAPSGTSGRRLGSTASRARSGTSAGCPRSCCSTTPGRWSTPSRPARPARWCSTTRFHAFARYWGVRPRACAPYRARTKGKDERGVGYVKRNAIAGRSFASWAALEAHLARWTREVADVRVHGTTGEPPIARFERDEAAALRPLAGSAAVPAGARAGPARAWRRLHRCRHQPLQRAVALIGSSVTVVIEAGEVRVLHAGVEVARHAERRGRRERAVDRAHLAGASPASEGRGHARGRPSRPAPASCCGRWPSTSRPREAPGERPGPTSCPEC